MPLPDRACVAAVALAAALLVAALPASAVECGELTPSLVDRVIASFFAIASPSCDINGDGSATAADVTEVVVQLALQLAVPSPTPTEVPSLTASSTPTPTASPTVSPTGSPTASPTASETPTPEPSPSPSGTETAAATASPTETASVTQTPSASETPSSTETPSPTETPTSLPCPDQGAELSFEIDNPAGLSPIALTVSGERVVAACTTEAGETSYSRDCDGGSCDPVANLAPGVWVHHLRVTSPDKGQLQHRRSLLIASPDSNRLHFTIFAEVLTVLTTANSGDGSLRKVLQDTLEAGEEQKPLLIQFDGDVFPAGTPTAITLAFQLSGLAADDVTIDGIDAGGEAGNRVIDANGLAIPAFTISGARNHLIGLRLRNAGGNNRDVLNISGAGADGNLIERTIVENAASADAVGVDLGAGKGFDSSLNVIRDCEISGAADKGVKVTNGAYARVESSHVFDNRNGGIQATLGGRVQAWNNLVESNRGSTAQNGLSTSGGDGSVANGFSELDSRGNISRRNGANGISVRGFSVARVRDSYLADNGTSGIRVFNDVGIPATAVVDGTTAACNQVDGAVIADMSFADFGGGPLGSSGSNAFTQNNIGGDNFRNASGRRVSAVNNQWEHCGFETSCDEESITLRDLSNKGAHTITAPSQAHRSLQPPLVTEALPRKGEAGELLRIFGTGFNAIDGHFDETQCTDVAGRNRCVPLRGNCVRIGGEPAPVEAVTPTMLVVRWPSTCIEPVALVVTTDQGPIGLSSEPITVCTNE